MFFVLPHALWKIIKRAICKLIIPFNGGGFTYESLVCAGHMYNLKPALKDIWCFVISLLAVRSPLITSSLNYSQLPSINLRRTKLISKHRDCAAVDFWRGSYNETGELLPPKNLTSSAVYNLLVVDVYLVDSIEHSNSKISKYLCDSGFVSLSSPLSIIISNLFCAKNVPFYLTFHHFSLLNNSLATCRRMRHQQHITVDNVKPRFFCGLTLSTLLYLSLSLSLKNYSTCIAFARLNQIS